MNLQKSSFIFLLLAVTVLFILLLADYLQPDEIKYLEKTWRLDTRNSEFLAPPLVGPGAQGTVAKNRLILKKLKRRGYAQMPVDRKRLASWNAMLLRSLVTAAGSDKSFTQLAHRQFRTMLDMFFLDGELLRLAHLPDVAPASFEDYAQVANAFAAYSRQFNHDKAGKLAGRLIEEALTRFLVNERWQPDTHTPIPAARADWIIADHVFVAPMTLWLETALSDLRLRPATYAIAREMVNRISTDLLDAPHHYGSYILLNRQLPHRSTTTLESDQG